MVLLVTLLSNQIAFAAKITPGTTCKAVGKQLVQKGKVFTCIKLGKKLYWDNGQPLKLDVKPISPATPTPFPTPTPSNSKSALPAVGPSSNPSVPTPLLRESDVTIRSTKLTVSWSGIGIDKSPLINLRRLNVWILDSQVNPLVGPMWRIAGFLAPNSGATFETTLPNREHSVKISAVFLSGEETGYSSTIRVVPNPVQISTPSGVIAEWEKSDFKIKFVHNSSEEYFSAYLIKLNAGGLSKILEMKPNPGASSHTFVLTLQGNQSLFGPAQSVISGSVRTLDIFGKAGEEVVFAAPAYKSSLPSP